MDSYIETFEKAIKHHKNGNDDKSVPAPFLVHRTSFQPKRTETGYDVGSTFYEQGGLNQKDINPVDGYHNAMNVHFAAQGSVVDHTGGKWGERKWSLYAPYIPALAENGLPETCLTADTAFVSTDEPVHLPGAILIEDVAADQLGSDFTRTAPDGHIWMANSITPENRDSALTHIESMREAFGNSHALMSAENYIRSGESDTGYANINTIRDIVGANKIASAPDFYFHEKSVNGFLSFEDTNRLSEILSSQVPDPSGFKPGATLHNAMAGNTLRHPDRLNKTELEAIVHDNNNHPKLRDMAEKISTSDFHRELRSKAMLETFRGNDLHIPLRGQEGDGGKIHFCHFLSGRHNHRETLLYGAIPEHEATNIFSHHLTPDERQKVIDHAAKVEIFPDGKLWEKLNKLDQSAHLQESHDRAKAFEQTLRNGTDEKAASNDSLYDNKAGHLSEKEPLPVQKSSTHGETPMSTQQTAMPHCDDAIHAQLIKNNNKFDAFAASMDAFNNQPAIKAAHERAIKYGMDPKASIHEALDNHPNLKTSYLNLHENFHKHIQPAMEKHMELIGQMQDPDMKNRAMKSIQGRMEHMANAQKNWPDRDSVMQNQSENKQGQQGKPGLGDIIARFLAKLKEIITGKPAQAETAKQTSDHSATVQKVGDAALAVVAPEVAVAKTVAQSVGQNAQNGQAQRPGMRRK